MGGGRQGRKYTSPPGRTWSGQTLGGILWEPQTHQSSWEPASLSANASNKTNQTKLWSYTIRRFSHCWCWLAPQLVIREHVSRDFVYQCINVYQLLFSLDTKTFCEGQFLPHILRQYPAWSYQVWLLNDKSSDSRNRIVNAPSSALNQNYNLEL